MISCKSQVNVFLGLGLPWLIAALYWGGAKATDEWLDFYKGVEMSGSWGAGKLITEEYPDGGFVVRLLSRVWSYSRSASFHLVMGCQVLSGSLGFSVIIFCLCACMCLGTLAYRRKTVGAELGGDMKVAKQHAVFFVSLWFFYIVMSILSSGDNPAISL